MMTTIRYIEPGIAQAEPGGPASWDWGGCRLYVEYSDPRRTDAFEVKARVLGRFCRWAVDLGLEPEAAINAALQAVTQLRADDVRELVIRANGGAADTASRAATDRDTRLAVRALAEQVSLLADHCGQSNVASAAAVLAAGKPVAGM